MEFRGWPAEASTWFEELGANNTKAWFHANRATYDEAVRGPLEALVDDVMAEFGELRVSRPNRDTRFSKDKTPYKPDIYAMNRRPDGSGYYVRYGRDGLSVGGGLYAPDRARLAQVREAIDDDVSGADLVRVLDGLEASGLALMRAGALKTAPKGYPVDHPRIELLRLPHLAAVANFRPAPWMRTPKAEDRIVTSWRALAPLLDWLASTA